MRHSLIRSLFANVFMWVLATAVGAGPLFGQAAQGDTRQNTIRVFLDCNTQGCNDDYFRTEVDFVNWVRDRTQAQVHVIVTGSETGSGGRAYSLDFIGLGDMEGEQDVLTFNALGTDTQDEVLAGVSQVLAAGLARFATVAGQPGAFEILRRGGVEDDLTDRLVTGDQVEDPWNFWVFEISSDMEFEGEETESSRRFSGSFEARRITTTWKMEFEADGNFSRDEIERSDGTVRVDDRTNWSTDALVAHAIAPHWSIGVAGGAGASTSNNQDFNAELSPALEFSYFPYEEAPRRSLTAFYEIGPRHFRYEEETIFDETAETRLQHELTLRLFQRQTWGDASVTLRGRQYLHDTSLYGLLAEGNLEFRITRGLSLEVSSEVERIRDQLFISREGLSDEDILLGRFERPTDYQYEFSVGFSFQFGSIFNNVVNNRF